MFYKGLVVKLQLIQMGSYDLIVGYVLLEYEI